MVILLVWVLSYRIAWPGQAWVSLEKAFCFFFDVSLFQERDTHNQSAPRRMLYKQNIIRAKDLISANLIDSQVLSGYGVIQKMSNKSEKKNMKKVKMTLQKKKAWNMF